MTGAEWQTPAAVSYTHQMCIRDRANLLRQRTEEHSTNDRGDVIADRDDADRFRLEAVLNFQKDRVKTVSYTHLSAVI